MDETKLENSARLYALGEVDTCHSIDFKAGAKWGFNHAIDACGAALHDKAPKCLTEEQRVGWWAAYERIRGLAL